MLIDYRQALTLRPKTILMSMGYRVGHVTGGPYSMRDLRLFTVKLACEVPGYADVTVPIRDYDVPSTPFRYRWALFRTALKIAKGKRVYVGCGWGIGRTGTFLAMLHKLDKAVCRKIGVFPSTEDDLKWVRYVYHPKAVETVGQEKFLRSFDLGWVPYAVCLCLEPSLIFDKRLWL